MTRANGIVELGADDTRLIVEVLSDAFYEYPVMRYVLGDNGDYRTRLDRLVYLFVMGRVLRADPIEGLLVDKEIVGVATMSFPNDGKPEPPEMAGIRADVWADLGEAERMRYERCMNAWDPLNPPVPHTHLNMIGVRRKHHGAGVARKLLDHVHYVGERAAESEGVSLTTELPRNVAIYQHFGYEVTGHVHVDTGLETWALFRAAKPASAK